MIISTAGNTPSSLGDLVCAATSFDDVGSRFTQFMIELSYLRDTANSSSSNHPALRTLGQTVRLLLKGCQFKVFRRPLV